ncbi:MAG: dipeptidase [bacterium]
MSKKLAAVHERTLTVDTHIDWPSRQFRSPGFVPGERHKPKQRQSGQWDLVRMKEGGLDAVFMSIFTAQGPRNEEGHQKAKEHALKLIALTGKLVADYPDQAELARTADEVERIVGSGKRVILMGMENGYPIGEDHKNVEMFYNLGVRYITLTHSRNNELGDSSTDPTQEWGGLSPLGEQVVHEMNRLGIMVDISHVHDDTFWDVMKIVQAPVIASHSSSWTMNEHQRNMKDDMLKEVAKNNGVVQVCLLGEFIKKMPPNPQREEAMKPLQELRLKWRNAELSEEEEAKMWRMFSEIDEKFPANRPTLKDAVDHVDHMVKVMGIAHVGIGSDFDGGGGLVDIDEVSLMPNITKELLRRGYSEEDIRKIWGGNLLRVMRTVEKTAESLRAKGVATK